MTNERHLDLDTRQSWDYWLLSKIFLYHSGLQKSTFHSLCVANFYNYQNGAIFLVAKEISQSGQRATLVAITERLREIELLESVGGENYLCSLAAAVVVEHGWL